jgi:hypothetical protein
VNFQNTFSEVLMENLSRNSVLKVVVKLADGKLQFADMAPAANGTTEPGTQPTGESTDAPAE